MPGNRRHLTVLAGPSGVGKGTIVKELLHRYPDVFVSTSVTTRAPRPGEKDGQHYFFVSPRQFNAMVEAHKFLEWATVHGTHRYGTPKEPVIHSLEADRPALLEIDVAGAYQVRRAMPDAVMIFVLPPTFEELYQRLQGRGSENPDQIQRRLLTAKKELESASDFDYQIVNQHVDRAVDELAHIMGLA